MRKPIIAGNWKMHNTIEEGIKLVREIKSVADNTDVEVVVCVPFTSLSEIKKELQGTKVKLGAQNMHWEEKGAYTGEISPVMLKEIGVDYVIIGHSERRQYFNETDETVNKKVISALKYGIKPIICVGETLEQREKNIEKDVVSNQIIRALENVSAEDMLNVVIAYEPIWAIGTGKTASSKDANDMISFIRKTIRGKYGVDISEEVRIQYGGSVKPHNVTELMNESDIDGALVGGASLKAEDFINIVNF
ncbi:triosephosphate isomerase [Caloranaerobacter azorensis H53214]|uniref:Triosephosphate isomerase n=1 Tax=Caloranaerobacter azorensis H53214 TaxID=1156417 RepID=A0A096DLY3_9FIRM|nr:triose-phosphate isomerase [Caloranaerobacter azorensis]KGG80291.1 triosephosphate isomerase [Caloranaerobacter azorensis H53214]